MTNRKISMKKIIWNLLLFISCALFLVGLQSSDLLFLGSSLVLAVIIRVFGFQHISYQKVRKES